MLRYNSTNEGIIKEYKNNNITIKLNSNTIESIKIGRYSDNETIESRKILRLYAHTPTDAEREEIEKWESDI